MKYILSQKLVSFGDDFFIEDESGNRVYTVDGKMFSIGDKLWFKDMNGKKIYKLKEKLVKLSDTFIIEKDKEDYAKLRKKMFTVPREKFFIESPYGEIEAKGDFIDYDFKFYLDGENIAEVSKKFLAIRDKYTIEINNFQEPTLILACAVIIDMIMHDDKNSD